MARTNGTTAAGEDHNAAYIKQLEAKLAMYEVKEDAGNDENYNLSCELAELLNTNNCSHFIKALIENKYYKITYKNK